MANVLETMKNDFRTLAAAEGKRGRVTNTKKTARDQHTVPKNTLPPLVTNNTLINIYLIMSTTFPWRNQIHNYCLAEWKEFYNFKFYNLLKISLKMAMN